MLHGGLDAFLEESLANLGSMTVEVNNVFYSVNGGIDTLSGGFVGTDFPHIVPGPELLDSVGGARAELSQAAVGQRHSIGSEQ